MNELIIIFQKEWVIATPPKPRHQQVGHLDFFEVKYLQVLSGFHIFRYLFDELWPEFLGIRSGFLGISMIFSAVNLHVFVNPGDLPAMRAMFSNMTALLHSQVNAPSVLIPSRAPAAWLRKITSEGGPFSDENDQILIFNFDQILNVDNFWSYIAGSWQCSWPTGVAFSHSSSG